MDNIIKEVSYDGKLEWKDKLWDDDPPSSFYFDGVNILRLFKEFEHKNIRITIEVLDVE